MGEKTTDLLRRLRPTLTIDTATGAPFLSVDFEAASAPDTLEDVLDMVAYHARSTRLCVVFDEFQDMLNVENAQGILATIRGKIQFQPNTPYIFLGSVRAASSLYCLQSCQNPLLFLRKLARISSNAESEKPLDATYTQASSGRTERVRPQRVAAIMMRYRAKISRFETERGKSD